MADAYRDPGCFRWRTDHPNQCGAGRSLQAFSSTVEAVPGKGPGPNEARKRETQTELAVLVSGIFLAAALGLGGYWWWNNLHPGPKGAPNQVSQTKQALTTENTTAPPLLLRDTCPNLLRVGNRGARR